MPDQKITELETLSRPIGLNDIALIVGHMDGSSGPIIDMQCTYRNILNFIGVNLAVGAVITFTNTTPSNSAGLNGDVVIKPASGQFWQKVANVWVLQYTVPGAGIGNTVLYGTGAPNDATGSNGDSYINTDGGIFYKKSAGTWATVFTMATGPAGTPGAAGADGANGTNGNTVLTGTAPPSNSTDGVNGDYFINKSTYFIYGPKAAGVWPAGVSLITNTTNFKQIYTYGSDSRFVYDSGDMTLTFNLNAGDKLLFPLNASSCLMAALRIKIDGSNTYKTKAYDYSVTDDGTNYTSVLFEGVIIEATTQIVLY